MQIVVCYKAPIWKTNQFSTNHVGGRSFLAFPKRWSMANLGKRRKFMAQKPFSGHRHVDESATIVSAKVRCDGQLHWLKVDSECLVLEKILQGHGKGLKRMPSAEAGIKKSRLPNLIPICEILAVKFFDGGRVGGKGGCLSCRASKSKDRRSLSSKEIALVSSSFSLIQRSIETRSNKDQLSATRLIGDHLRKRSISGESEPGDQAVIDGSTDQPNVSPRNDRSKLQPGSDPSRKSISRQPSIDNRNESINDVADRHMAFIEQETESIAIYFVRRRADNVWRVGELKCHFNISIGSDDGSAEATIFGTSPSATAAEFIQHLRNQISRCPRPKRLLVFINPFGGSKRAIHLYKKHALPIFDLCAISATVIETKRPLHATEYVSQADLTGYDGIIAAGGDGLFNEVLNGLVIRKQRELKININDRKSELKSPGVTVGLIAAGSTNALAFTIHGTGDPLTSILHIAIGDRRGIDVCGVYDEERFLRFACTAMSYGFLGDLLKESERLRRFGPPRYAMSGIKVWFRNSCYGGMVRYKTQYGSRHDGNAKDLDLNPCRSGCDLCSNYDPALDNAKIKRQASTTSLQGDDNSDAVWSIVDDFAHLVCVVTPCLCKVAPDGISPVCHLGDGCMHLAMISKLGRFQNLAILSKIMSKNTDHTRERRFRFFEVKEFSFTPRCFVKPTFTRSASDVVKTTPQKDSTASASPVSHHVPQMAKEKSTRERRLGGWNVDGELLAQPHGTIYFRVHRQLITLFARGIEAQSPETPE